MDRDSASFDSFLEAAIKRPDIFPGIQHRIAWLEFKRLFSAIISGPTWATSPATFREWKESKISKSRLEVLQRRLAPETNGWFEKLPKEVPLPDLFNWLERCYRSIRSGLKADLTPSPRSVAAIRRSLGALPEGFSKGAAVERMLENLGSPPCSISATLLHGSLADGLVVEGFSDADVLCFVAAPAKNKKTFWTAAQWLYQLNHGLFAINPCMHHGPMIAFADEANCATEAGLPSAILRHGVWCHGEISTISYYDGLFENVMALADFEFYFERHHLFVPSLRHAFDALWWTSNALILPVLLHQVVSGTSIYKRDCLTGDIAGLPQELRSTIHRVSMVRERLGNWITGHLPREIKTEPEANPGLIVAKHKNKLKLTGMELRRLGLGDSLMSEVRQLWEHVRTKVLTIGVKFMKQEEAHGTVSWRWRGALTRLPQALDHANYEQARAQFVARCRTKPEVKAVFEFGEVGCPGLSDLDFCVVLDDGFQSVPGDLRATAFPEETAYIMDHDPLFVSASMATQLGAFFPIFAARQLVGVTMELPLSSSFPAIFQEATLTYKNLRKYPADLDWLISQETLNVRSLLGLLHSANHIERCLKTLGTQVPANVKNAVALDATVRSRFKTANHIFSQADIFQVIETCASFCEPLRATLLGYWLNRAKHVSTGPTDSFPMRQYDAHWLQAELSVTVHHTAHTPYSDITLYPLVAEYLEAKEQFCSFENQRMRPQNIYIDTSHGDLTKIEAEFNARLNELHDLYSAADALKNERNLLRAQLADLQVNFSAVEKDRMDRGALIETQGRNLTKLEVEFDARLKELKDLYSSADALKNERNLLRAQLADLKANFSAVEKDRIDRGALIEIQGKKLTKLEVEFDVRLKELKDLYSSADALKNERNLLRAQLADLKANFSAAEKDRIDRGALIEIQGKKLTKLEVEFDVRLKELKDLYSSADALKNERNLLRAQLADLQVNFSAVEKDRIDRGALIEVQGKKLTKLEVEFDVRLKELKDLYSSADALKNERNLLQAQLTDLQANFSAVEKDRVDRGYVIQHQGERIVELEKLVWRTEQNRDYWKNICSSKQD